MSQACTAANRFIVHEAVADEFSRRIAERVKAMKIGRGGRQGSRARRRCHRARRDPRRRRRGARGAPGTLYQPTVVTGVQRGSAILHEEIFDPLLAIATFRTEDEAMRLANDTSTAWSRTSTRKTCSVRIA